VVIFRAAPLPRPDLPGGPATPHIGKQDDFQLFMALPDADRLESNFGDGLHTADVSDLTRRMVNESLLKLDGNPPFPERIANTPRYKR
jgi:hypothetical protein